MDKEIRLVLIKFFTIATLIAIYIGFMVLFVGPLVQQMAYGLWEKEQAINNMEPIIDLIKQYIINQAYGQSAFDTPNQYNQQPQYQQQYQQPQYNQYDQYNQQPYQQYGTPYQQPYYGQQQYGIPQPQNPIQFGTSEIIYTILGGGAIGYARYNQTKRNQDKELTRELYAELLREKQEKRELARVQYQHMPLQGNEITDAPSIQLHKLDQDIDTFSEKVAKA